MESASDLVARMCNHGYDPRAVERKVRSFERYWYRYCPHLGRWRYTSLAEWRADRARHRVPEGSPKDWDGRGRMYAWRVEQYYALRRPLEPPEQKGNINSKPVTRALAPDSWVV